MIPLVAYVLALVLAWLIAGWPAVWVAVLASVLLAAACSTLAAELGAGQDLYRGRLPGEAAPGQADPCDTAGTVSADPTTGRGHGRLRRASRDSPIPGGTAGDLGPAHSSSRGAGTAGDRGPARSRS